MEYSHFILKPIIRSRNKEERPIKHRPLMASHYKDHRQVPR